MAQAIMQAPIKAANSEIMAVREANNLVNNVRPIQTTPKSGDPALRQPTFDWKVANKYQEM